MRQRSLWIIAILALALGGCTLPGLGNVGMPDDGQPIPVTDQAAASFEQKAAEAAQTAQSTGSSSITVTQEEITSYVALRLEEAAAQAGSPVAMLLRQPQIYFKEDGTIIVRGQLEFEGSAQPLRVVARPSVANQQLQLDIVEGRIGPIPVPGAILDQVEGLLATAILQAQNYAELQEVRVEAGTLTLSGARVQ
ncbi:MAG: hypothetical protein ACRDIB_08570 [Ardenticatenaceae bacterium]